MNEFGTIEKGAENAAKLSLLLTFLASAGYIVYAMKNQLPPEYVGAGLVFLGASLGLLLGSEVKNAPLEIDGEYGGDTYSPANPEFINDDSDLEA